MDLAASRGTRLSHPKRQFRSCVIWSFSPKGFWKLAQGKRANASAALGNEVCVSYALKGQRKPLSALSGHNVNCPDFLGRRSRWSLALGWIPRPLRGEDSKLRNFKSVSDGDRFT